MIRALMLTRCFVLVLCYAVALAAAQREWPTTDFKTEPSFKLTGLNLTIFTKDRSLLAPGYIFIANGLGPQIYDQDANLIWHRHSKEGHRDQDFHPCDYLGEGGIHLCWHDNDLKGHLNTAPGRNVIYNQQYEQIAINYTTGIRNIGPNLHAFHMLPGGNTFLQPVYVPKWWDLRPYGGKEKGKIWDGCFQEVDVRTAEPLFEWCVSDHHPVWESTLFFTANDEKDPEGQTNVTSAKAGHGTGVFPWDFFHINAIDKNFEGDYLVSGRHFDQILKIAGPRAREVHDVEPGKTLWRLGGVGGDFDMDGFNFTKQHAVRYMSTGPSETVISLLNNAWEGTVDPSASRSAGQIIKINNETMQAELLNEYPHPYNLLAGSQGDMQVLPNNNVFMGWGQLPGLTEFDHEGNVLFHAQIQFGDFHVNSYRTFKAPWHGKPNSSPKLLAYMSSCEATSPLIAYVSWNGATEVRTWRFHIATQLDGPWIPAGKWEKAGFETRATPSSMEWLSPFMPYVSVEALDDMGTVLGSTTSKTWVPNPNMNITCDDWGCSEPDHFDYDPDLSFAGTCQSRDRPAFIALAVLILLIESLNYFRQTLSLWVVDKLGQRRRQVEYSKLEAIKTSRLAKP